MTDKIEELLNLPEPKYKEEDLLDYIYEEGEVLERQRQKVNMVFAQDGKWFYRMWGTLSCIPEEKIIKCVN